MAEPKNHTTKYPADTQTGQDDLVSCEDLEERGFKPATAYVDPETGEIYVFVDGDVWTVVGSR